MSRSKAAGGGGSRGGSRVPAAELPVARVLVDVSPHHLDRPFDYLIPARWDAEAVPGCRVRVRFNGRLLDGFLLERVAESEYAGRLSWLQRVVSTEPVLSGRTLELVRAVARRYAGTMSDVVSLAVPPRHAGAENEPAGQAASAPAAPSRTGWGEYENGRTFLEAVHAGRPARAVWQALPGEDWARRLAELVATAAAAGRGTVVVVPDQRDLDRLSEVCTELLGAERFVALSGELDPAERYRRWLAVHRGKVRTVVGTRAAVFAPVAEPGLLVVWDDGDELHAYPRAPYPHVRDVLTHRSHAVGAALLVGGFARTAEAGLLVESGWAREIVAPRPTVRARAPRVTAVGEDDRQLERDPDTRAARLPAVAFEAARNALRENRPVLVQVPRKGYVPALACAGCRERARCRHCGGPLAVRERLGTEITPVSCRWCGHGEAGFRCDNCGSDRLRAIVVGASRTAEELGRAFSGVVVRTSGGGRILDRVPSGPSLVVSTPGAEPPVAGGYGAALLLDARALLSRPDLRAGEQALRLWLAAASLVRPADRGGRVVVLADSSFTQVQALVRWDPRWYASVELAARNELGFPPVKRVASVDGSASAVTALLERIRLPEGAEVLGPVPLEEDTDSGPRERALVRAPRQQGRALADALWTAQAAHARSGGDPVRVRLDPLELI
ncbi:primosomal protein N' [Actinopolyspora mortivallis]|uniref:primosomal protein N' n=1 Tax=Actinopolyspora mortivallis TaxID=33906 RepID=UPI0003A71A2D|nr:primosomal protein N' [Actinopolyspora mortivallis]